MKRNKYFIFIFIIILAIVLYIAYLYFQRKKRYVVSNFKGRLGNCVFQVFAAKMYSELYGHEVVFCDRFIIDNPKEAASIDDLRSIFPEIKTVEDIGDYEHFDFSDRPWKYEHLPKSTKSVVLEGYFQNVGYIPKSIQDSPPIRKRPVLKNTYFIHIRGGDYLNLPKHYVDLRKYYHRCIQKVFEHNPSAEFLVFSDDIEYAKIIMKELGVDYTISTKTNPYETLLEMSSCVGAICANSSFSWIGSFSMSTRNQIYMPSKWYNDDSKNQDVYPPWAKVVSVD
jgi:hypothetical protein